MVSKSYCADWKESNWIILYVENVSGKYTKEKAQENLLYFKLIYYSSTINAKVHMALLYIKKK